jgi:hypothetical protein
VQLLKDAERDGLVNRPDLGTLVLMPPLVQGLYEFCALNYLLLTHFAKVTLDHIEAAEDPARRG